MKRLIRSLRTRALLTLVCLLLSVSGCELGGRTQATSFTVTEQSLPSAMVAVVPGPAAAPLLASVITATARPDESVSVVAADTASVLATGTEPLPAKIVIAGRPLAPLPGATPFQLAKYRRSLASWQATVASARRAVAARTQADLSSWVGRLGIEGKSGRPSRAAGSGGLARPAGPPGALAAECAAAASAFAGLDEEAGASFGNRRVVLLYASSLGGSLPAGELTGDDVIVDASFLPPAAAVAEAQASLLTAGAAQATVLGPEATRAQIALLISAGLSQAAVVTSDVSRAILFGNNSAALTPAAARLLTSLVTLLRQPGAFAWINGYASTPGSNRTNYFISYARAARTALFFEAHGVPAASLAVVGHGASDPVAAGGSGRNRRVVVVIEVPGRA
jgi:outer membrane protein OmpA-like peptidoglycan-associated protein